MTICPICKIRKCIDYPKGYSRKTSSYCIECARIKNAKDKKKNNYKYEKTSIQKLLRNIKRKTRYYFKLEGHRCEFCGNKATEHHHNTNPIEFDKFNYVCHECHIVQNRNTREVKND